MDGRVLTSGREIQAAVRSSPPGTTFHYILNRGSRLVEADVRSVVRTVRDFERYLLEGFVTAILFLALGAFVLWLKPGVPETRLFLVFCLTWFCIPALYLDAHSHLSVLAALSHRRRAGAGGVHPPRAHLSPAPGHRAAPPARSSGCPMDCRR